MIIGVKFAILAILTRNYQKFVKNIDARYKIKVFVKLTLWGRANSPTYIDRHPVWFSFSLE